VAPDAADTFQATFQVAGRNMLPPGLGVHLQQLQHCRHPQRDVAAEGVKDGFRDVFGASVGDGGVHGYCGHGSSGR
jgi:hypothetical protein